MIPFVDHLLQLSPSRHQLSVKLVYQWLRVATLFFGIQLCTDVWYTSRDAVCSVGALGQTVAIASGVPREQARNTANGKGARRTHMSCCVGLKLALCSLSADVYNKNPFGRCLYEPHRECLGIAWCCGRPQLHGRRPAVTRICHVSCEIMGLSCIKCFTWCCGEGGC